VERGGNVEGAKPGEVVDLDGIKIVGYTNVAGRVAASASGLLRAQSVFVHRNHDRQGQQGACRRLGG